jgi:hypothetical protein
MLLAGLYSLGRPREHGENPHTGYKNRHNPTFKRVGPRLAMSVIIDDASVYLEAAIGIEPMNKGFADLCLTTWLRRRIVRIKDEGGKMKQPLLESPTSFRPSSVRLHPDFVERETRFELATLALARRCSTPELLPL